MRNNAEFWVIKLPKFFDPSGPTFGSPFKVAIVGLRSALMCDSIACVIFNHDYPRGPFKTSKSIF